MVTVGLVLVAVAALKPGVIPALAVLSLAIGLAL